MVLFWDVTGAFGKVSHINKCMTDRQLCPLCFTNLVAVNYKRDDVTHYRSMCAACIRKDRKLKPQAPGWSKSGYKKKPHCELCGFKLKYPSQSVVFHVDGNLKNNNWVNLKTVCLNCQQEVTKGKVSWKVSPIIPDF